MTVVRHEDGRLLLGGVDLATLGIPTPAYVYDLSGMQRAAGALVASFEGAPHQVAYAIKAHSAAPGVRRYPARERRRDSAGRGAGPQPRGARKSVVTDEPRHVARDAGDARPYR